MQSLLDFLATHQFLGAFALNLLRAIAWVILLTAIFAPLEFFFSIHPGHRTFHKGWTLNLGWYFVNGLTAVFILGPPVALIAWIVHTLLPASLTGAAGALPLWARMVLAMLVGEIGFYWGHRWSHKIPLLWRFHAIHHSATQVNFLVNTLAHPFDLVFTRLCGIALLFATGLAAPVGPGAGIVPAVVLLVGATWSFFVHANVRVRLGPLEQIIATPAFHHWHHTLEDHKDLNYAPMLPFIDRLFGTLYLPKTWPAAYGTATPVPRTLIGQLLDPLLPQRPLAPAKSATAG